MGIDVTGKTSFRCQMTITTTLSESGANAQEVACIFKRDYMWPIDNFPLELYNTYQSDISSGSLWMRISKVHVNEFSRMETNEFTTYKVVSSSSTPDDSTTVVSRTVPTSRATARSGLPTRLSGTTSGTQSLYVIRIVTSDSKPTYTLPQIKRQLVGKSDSDTRPNFRRQYRACSFGQLDFQYKGGHTVKINKPVKSFASASALVSAALEKSVRIKGLTQGSDFADKVIIVTPPGTNGDWLANAGLNYFRSTYNDKWVMSLGTLIHEVGHNFGLFHSGEPGKFETDAEYGDKSGYMVRQVSFGFFALYLDHSHMPYSR